jgi:hypothetical protein
MKALLILVTFSLILFSCKKEEFNSLNESKENSMNSSAYNAVVYASISCIMPNGKPGCTCKIVTDNDDCSLQTPCTPNSAFIHYNRLLTKRFTPEEIIYRSENNIKITEPELLRALKKDGFPIK